MISTKKLIAILAEHVNDMRDEFDQPLTTEAAIEEITQALAESPEGHAALLAIAGDICKAANEVEAIPLEQINMDLWKHGLPIVTDEQVRSILSSLGFSAPAV